jgi:hypothetical protein
MMKMLFVVCIISMLAATGAAAQDGGSGGIEIELNGQPLALAEMEEATGGLPRCCRDLDYDPIEDKCLNNKGQPYKENENDCDIWIENNLKQSCIDIASKWGSASSTTVPEHLKNLFGQMVSEAPLGWSIEFIDGTHVALIRVNNDGSADIFHQGFNKATSTAAMWEGSRGYHYENAHSAYWGNNPQFWGFDR